MMKAAERTLPIVRSERQELVSHPMIQDWSATLRACGEQEKALGSQKYDSRNEKLNRSLEKIQLGGEKKPSEKTEQ